MAGLIGRLFGGKNADKEPSKQSASAQKQKREAYFLETNDANSLGNMDYLKKVKADQEQIANATEPIAETPQQTQEKITPRRQAGSNMDMFRNMARDIKQKK